MRVLPFTIGDLDFIHTEGDDELDRAARDYFRQQADVAVFAWRRDDGYTTCSHEEGTIVFALVRDGEFWGTWALYRVRPAGADPNVVTALPAPMFHDIGVGSRVGKEDISEEREAARREFWKRVNTIMEWMLDDPMPLEGGGSLVVERFRFPDFADHDPAQHEWAGVEDDFAQDSKKVHVSNEEGVLRELLPIDKVLP